LLFVTVKDVQQIAQTYNYSQEKYYKHAIILEIEGLIVVFLYNYTLLRLFIRTI